MLMPARRTALATHLPALGRYPSLPAALACLGVGTVALAPLAYVYAGFDPFMVLDTSYLRYWGWWAGYAELAGPVLLAIHGVGLLALALAGAQVLGWLVDRAQEQLPRLGLAWADTRALLAGAIFLALG